MTYPASEIYSYTMERKLDETMDKSTSVVHSTMTRIKVVAPISTATYSHVSLVEYKVTASKLFPKGRA